MHLPIGIAVLLATAIAQIASANGAWSAPAAVCPIGYVVVWKTCFSGVAPYPCYDCKLRNSVVSRPQSPAIGKHPSPSLER